jgi:Tat protein secretion system quality control protein TatD with DNase activity
VPLVAQQVAQTKNLSLEQVGRLSTDNFYRLFSKATELTSV